MTFKITYITLSNDKTSFKIQTNTNSTTGFKPGVFIEDFTGIFEPGESNDEATPRGQSDGSVLPARPTYRGKDITLNLVFKGNDTIKTSRYTELLSIFKDGTVPGLIQLKTNGPGPYNCCFQRLMFPEGIDPRDDRLAIQVILSAKEAW